MRSTRNFIAVDLGGESGRVVAGTFDGQRIELADHYRFQTGGRSDDSTLRWDVVHFWNEIQKGLAATSNDLSEICSIGVDSWGVDYALLDSNDELLELPHHYRDSRNNEAVTRLLKAYPKEGVFGQTGIQFMDINTLCQLHESINSEGILKQAKCLLTIADYFHWCLCGSKSIEFTFATTTQCFNPETNDWAWPMLDALGIPTQLLPNVIQPGTHLGAVRTEIADQTGIGPASVVAPATHDTASAVVAVPVASSIGPNWAYISSGTWSLVGVEIDHPILSSEALSANVTNEGGVDGTWRLLKNVMGLWLVQRLRSALCERGFDRSYDQLAKLAASTDSTVCFIDPDDPSFLNPENMELAILQFCDATGQPKPADEAALVRCVLESLALRYCDVLDEVSQLAELEISVIHVVGGGCKNRLLNQFIANATGKPVVAGPSEATSIGNVMVQCKTADLVTSLNDIRNVVRNSVELGEFLPSEQSYWQQARLSFKDICSRRKSKNLAKAD